MLRQEHSNGNITNERNLTFVICTFKVLSFVVKTLFQNPKFTNMTCHNLNNAVQVSFNL